MSAAGIDKKGKREEASVERARRRISLECTSAEGLEGGVGSVCFWNLAALFFSIEEKNAAFLRLA